MSTPLKPIISEFDTQEEADAYDRWFHARVRASLENPRPSIPHDEVMAVMEEIIQEAERRRDGQALSS